MEPPIEENSRTAGFVFQLRDTLGYFFQPLISISMFGGAVGAAVSQRLIDRVGLRTLLLASVSVQVFIIAGLSIVLHPIMLVLIMFRNFSMSMARGPMLGAIAPHMSSAQRATFLSVLSLSGRAAISIASAMLSVFVVGNDVLNWAASSQVLALSAVVGAGALVFAVAPVIIRNS